MGNDKFFTMALYGSILFVFIFCLAMQYCTNPRVICENACGDAGVYSMNDVECICNE